MKRTALVRRTELSADPEKTRAFLQRGRGRIRQRPKRHVETPAEITARLAWKEPKAGKCRCGCSPPLIALHLENHHIVEQQMIKRLGRYDLLWDPRNALPLHPKHHAWHTSAFRRIPLASIPDAAVTFAIELLGEGSATVYLDRHYATTREQAA